mmetsp:Transcript_5753/g.6394  ORF Transcript_5753/g.6394 Transcript_5753/m.6394 type:complete len:315 (+) Transcript_5753:115-1059(+)
MKQNRTPLSLILFSVANSFLLQQPQQQYNPRRLTRPTVVFFSEISLQDNLPVEDTVTKTKLDLVEIAERTSRGFNASSDDKNKVNEIIRSLQRLKPTRDAPARDYYEPSSISSVTSVSESSNNDNSNSNRISGKWELVYTDAPDITGLDSSRNPFSTAKLGRIGQECSPPYIKNIIEWKRPEWAVNLPFSGSNESRILQKVVTSGVSTPNNPTFVDLKIVGLEVKAGNAIEKGKTNDNNDPKSSMIAGVVEIIQKEGIPVGIISQNPVDFYGPLQAPFGRFEIIYLDDEFRITRTNQNCITVNRRINKKEDEWF